MAIRAYKYRIYANKAVTKKLKWVLDRCRELYNASLQERKDAYEMCVKRHPGYYDAETRKRLTKEYAISCYDQINALPEIKEIRPEYQEIGSHVLQDVLRRLDKAFTAYFKRCTQGKTSGYPRFQGCNRYDTFTYPDIAGWKLNSQVRPPNKKGIVRVNLKLSKIGTVKLHLHRDMIGRVKTLLIKREGDHWYAIFSCEVDKSEPLPVSYEDVGIDLGVTHFAALSSGDFIESPRYYRKAEKKLRVLQQALIRKKRGSHRQAKAAKAVAKAHQKVRNQRADFLHKQSYGLVKRFQMIVFDDLKTVNLVKRPKPKQDAETGQYLPNGAAAKSGLNKSITDAGWGQFVGMCTYKAAWAGRALLQVDPKYTSQICSGCGSIVKKDLSKRWHSCVCGCEMHRDTNAAVNILHLGYKQLLAGTRPTSATA